MDEEEINGCRFRKDILYRPEEHEWAEEIDGGRYRLGVLPTTQATMGKITRTWLKERGVRIDAGRPMATLEAKRFMGHLNAPFTLEIIERNERLHERPSILQEDPYGDGWLYIVRPEDSGEVSKSLKTWSEVRDKLEEEVRRRGIMCFRVAPDYVYAALGIECSQVVMVLSDKVAEIPVGSTLHIIAEYDRDAEAALRSWGVATGNEVLDFRIEKKVAHALVRRVR